MGAAQSVPDHLNASKLGMLLDGWCLGQRVEVRCDPRLLWEGYDTHLSGARTLLEQYSMQLMSLMEQYGVTSEGAS